MQKKGQVALLVIVAIVIVGLIITFFAFRDKFSKAEKPTPEIGSIYVYVIDCIERTARDGLYEVGAKGGYYFPPANSLDDGEAYYVLGKRNLIPDNKTIESQIGAYIEVNLRNCINRFKPFPAVNISEGEISAKISLRKDRIIVNINYPLTIRKAGTNFVRSEFNGIEIYTRAYLLYNIASNYSNSFLKTGGLSLTYASSIEDSFNIITNFQHFPDYTLVTLTDSKGIGKNSTYEWRFALA